MRSHCTVKLTAIEGGKNPTQDPKKKSRSKVSFEIHLSWDFGVIKPLQSKLENYVSISMV